jgi:Heterokaryon incompatibility protein (HET)
MERIEHSYGYFPLDAAADEIRLLEILPGSEPARITGRLVKVSLNTSPIYDALSYTWGDPSITTTIILDGDQDFSVTTNLERALQDLRLEDEIRTIWVDALCIDQKNLAERSQQVSVMRTIYSKSTLVRVWIGLEIDIRTPAFAKLSKFGSVESNHAADGGLGNDPSLWSPLEPLFSHRYWTRLWVQQELLHAPDFVIHCRRELLSGKSIIAFQEELRERRALERHWAIVSEKISFQGSPLKHFRDWHRWVRCENDSGSSIADEVATPSALLREPLKASTGMYRRGSLLYCLASYRTLQVSDPKDKVFGILGLALDCREATIPICYEDIVASVYAETLRFLVTKYGTLDFLRFASVLEHRWQGGNVLPSWVPDWDIPSRVYAGMGHVRASGSLRALPNPITDDGLRLSVQGFRIDRVINDDSPYDILSKSVQWMIEKLKMLHNLALSKQDLGPVQRRATAAASQTAQVDGQTRLGFGEMEEDGFDAYGLLIRLLVSEWVSQDGEQAMFTESRGTLHFLATHHPNSTLAALLQNRRGRNLIDDKNVWMGIIGLRGKNFTVTEGGSIGLVTQSAVMIKDEVWILFGCPVPLVLRPRGRQYIVVCPASIPGLMRGEAVSQIPDTVEDGDWYEEYHVQTIDLR